MITLHVTTDIKDDRQVVLTLPPEVPTGAAELTVTIDSAADLNGRRAAELPDYAEVQTGVDAGAHAQYPLRGSVVRYQAPIEPVAEGDWEAAR